MSDRLEIACPYCHEISAVRLDLAGQQTRCPRCGKLIEIPDLGDAKTVTPGQVAPGEVAPAPVANETQQRTKPCPACGEQILQEARKCRFCGELLDASLRRGGGRASGPAPDTHLFLAIFTTLCCCMPFGVASIIYAAQVESKWHAGDAYGARAAADSARTWALVGIVSGLVINGIVFALQILAAM